MNDLGPKTVALLEHMAGPSARPTIEPRLDQGYRAELLPAGSVVRCGSREYVISNTGLCMLWEQPIPGSDRWHVLYAGRLADGEWMTPRQRAEVDEAAP